ncbi:MAG TPA: M23 family metallopeptidase [Vicinamibacterales bacterium]
MRIVRAFVVLLLLLLIGAGITYFFAGKAAGPAIAIQAPPVIGQTGALDVTVDAPGGKLDDLSIVLTQGAQTIPVLTLASAPNGAVVHEGADRLRVKAPIGRKSLPDLKSGQAQIVVNATRPVLRGLRHTSSSASKDVQVRLEPPKVSIVSTKHYVNVGGSEFVVYRASPPDIDSGVQVGELRYPGFPASGAGLTGGPDLKVAFFPLLFDQPADTPINLYARDAAGNEAHAEFDHRVFPKKFRHSTISIDDPYVKRVVVPILEQSPEVKASPDDPLPAFLKVNNELRKIDNGKIEAVGRNTAPAILWHGAFQPFGNAQVESAFADYRTYTYAGKDVDHQVHLGFDLARTVNSPVVAGNDGKVIHAKYLGIYGNCIILDHGMGVQSLYGHLSSFGVKEGDEVKKGQQIGVSGQTGMAGGDHLHFSMLVGGQFVNATEWWDPHWIEDRVMRKLREAGAPAQ